MTHGNPLALITRRLLAIAPFCAAAFSLTAASTAADEKIAFPIKIAETRRTFVDAKGAPVFWLGTTQWELFRGYSAADARTILEKSRDNGFTFVQVKLLGQGDGNQPNVDGQRPFTDGDSRTPNEEYFKNIDGAVRAAHEYNLAISMTVFHQSYRNHIPLDKARGWAKWLATRYRDAPNIVWSTTPEARQESVPILREIAAGLREGDPLARLITFKPDPAPAPSSSFINDEPWLDFNGMQVWNAVHEIYPMVTKDYNLKPTKPTLMAEGAYEAGSEYGFEVTPLWVRRQAYYSYLAGGHHTYGHNDSWRILPSWKQALDAPGAKQMRILRTIFESRPEWWLLVPDQSLLASGGRTEGNILNLAARHRDHKWAMFYLGEKSEFTIDRGKLGPGKRAATWLNPADGSSKSAGAVPDEAKPRYATPAGWEDAVLVVESEAR